MGIKKTNALNAKKRLFANMANDYINAHSVVGEALVNMDASGTIVETVVEIPYVCMGARFIGAPFARIPVRMA